MKYGEIIAAYEAGTLGRPDALNALRELGMMEEDCLEALAIAEGNSDVIEEDAP